MYLLESKEPEFYPAPETFINYEFNNACHSCLTVPSAPPSSIKIFKINTTTARLEWSEIPPKHRNGIIKEYRIRYKEICLTQTCSWWTIKTTNQSSLEISQLRTNEYYYFQICGVTVKGNGVWSHKLEMSTHFCK